MGLSMRGSTGSWGLKRDKEEVIDGHTGSDIFFGEVFDFGWVCGRQDLGSDSATDTLKKHDAHHVCLW